MAIYICFCEDEVKTNTCSGDCDLCIEGHTTDEQCNCIECQLENDELIQ